jgi:general secretion pathway protein D
MNLNFKIFLIFILVFGFACSHQGKTALNRADQIDNPINSMRLPDKNKYIKKLQERKNSPTIEIRAGSDNFNVSPSTSSSTAPEVLDQKLLNKIPEKPITKWVKVSGNNVPLRQGPGAEFKKVGVATKEQAFQLLSVKDFPGKKEPWYLVQNEKNKKFFISSLLSSITDTNKVEAASKNIPLDKEVIQKRKRVPQNGIRTSFDPTPRLPKSLRKAKHITLNFEGTEIYDVITTFCELLQIDYLIEGNLKGKVTLQTFNEIPVGDLYIVLEQILALHNITVLKSGNFYRFLPTKETSKKPLNIYYGNDRSIPPQERMIIQIIPLKYISVASMKKILTPLLSDNATFMEIPETQNIMLVEMGVNVKRILSVVAALDIDKLASSDIQLFKLNNADSGTVVAELEEIFSSMGYTESLGNSLNFLSLERMNSILVVNAFERILPSIEFWIKKLDQPISEGKSSTFVYYVQNGDAVPLSALLNDIFQGQGESDQTKDNKIKTKKPSTDEMTKLKKVIEKPKDYKQTSTTKIETEGGIEDSFQGEIIIIPDADTNSLVIRTSPRNYPALLALIKKLDLFPQQVLIEVLIIDVTLDAETRAGLEWVLQGEKGGNTFSGGVSQTPQTLGSLVGGGATASILQPGGSFLVSNPGSLITLLQAFASDSKANVLANPILVTTDNKTANISIADEIPIQSTTLTSAGAANPVTQSTIEYRSVGIKLDIIPKINSDNFVNLKLSQEISSLGPEIQGTPSFSTRLLNTEVVLKDNQVLVMGGLMRTDTIDSNEGVPVLRKIPYLGKLFSTDTETTKKTELMLFITPHIISNSEDSDFVTKQFQRRLGSFRKEYNQG